LITKPLCPCCRANVCHFGKPRVAGSVYVVESQQDVRRGALAEDFISEGDDSDYSYYSSDEYGSGGSEDYDDEDNLPPSPQSSPDSSNNSSDEGVAIYEQQQI
jgi:hypothetical protein